MEVCVYVSVCMCMCVYICHIKMEACVCLCDCVHMCICVCVYIIYVTSKWKCVCVYVCVHMCMCVYVYVTYKWKCMCVCVWVKLIFILVIWNVDPRVLTLMRSRGSRTEPPGRWWDSWPPAPPVLRMTEMGILSLVRRVFCFRDKSFYQVLWKPKVFMFKA